MTTDRQADGRPTRHVTSVLGPTYQQATSVGGRFIS